MMKGILIKAGGKAEVVELEGKTVGYEKIAELLKIESPVTVVERKVGKKYFDLWCDDEGLFKEELVVSGVLTQPKGTHELICGNILILNHDEEGNSVGLSDEEIDEVMRGYNIVDMDAFNTFRKLDLEKGQVFHGYWEGKDAEIKPHSCFLAYTL